MSFRISMLKSTVIKILEIMVSIFFSSASPIVSSVDVKIAFIDLVGLKKIPMRCMFLYINFYQDAHNVW